MVVPQAPCVRDVRPIVSGRCRATIRARRATTSSQRSRYPSTCSRLVRARRPSRVATMTNSQWHLPRRHHSPSLGRPPEFSTARVAWLLVRGRRAVPPAAAKGVRPRRRAAIGCAATISRRRASLVSPQARGAQGCSSASQEWCVQLSAMRRRRVLDSARIDAAHAACVGRVLA